MLATTDEQLAELGANPDGGMLLDHDEVLREEPALAPHVAGGLLLPRRVPHPPGRADRGRGDGRARCRRDRAHPRRGEAA